MFDRQALQYGSKEWTIRRTDKRSYSLWLYIYKGTDVSPVNRFYTKL